MIHRREVPLRYCIKSPCGTVSYGRRRREKISIIRYYTVLYWPNFCVLYVSCVSNHPRPKESFTLNTTLPLLTPKKCLHLPEGWWLFGPCSTNIELHIYHAHAAQSSQCRTSNNTADSKPCSVKTSDVRVDWWNLIHYQYLNDSNSGCPNELCWNW